MCSLGFFIRMQTTKLMHGSDVHSGLYVGNLSNLAEPFFCLVTSCTIQYQYWYFVWLIKKIITVRTSIEIEGEIKAAGNLIYD